MTGCRREIDVLVMLNKVEKGIFDLSLDIRKLLRSQSSVSSSTSNKGVRLPKLEVPTFDGNILNWCTFWEQFKVSVHDRTNLADSEKLAYLRNALKNGSAKTAIEGLSRSGEHYTEAIDCLKSRYEKPRLIHQAHVHKILEIPSLKEGNGRELRRLHDCAQQHLRALKAMGQEPSGSFVTSVLELKLDMNTMFEWQRHSQKSIGVPHYQQLLDFINLRAQASEATVPDTNKKPTKSDAKKGFGSNKSIASYAMGTDTGNCILCKSDKHPLYVCSRFKSLSHDEKLSTLRSNGLCLNCLRPGHFVKGCRSLHKCRVCQKPHHTLLHLEESKGSRPSSPSDSVPGSSADLEATPPYNS